MFCGLGPPGDSLLIEVSVYIKGLRQVLRDGTAWRKRVHCIITLSKRILDSFHNLLCRKAMVGFQQGFKLGYIFFFR